MTLVYECKVQGIDAGGFAWQNVFHVSSTYGGPDSDFSVAGVLNGFLYTTLNVQWGAAMNSSAKILTIASRAIEPTPGFTNLLVAVIAGARAGNPSVGALSGRLVFLPTAAPLHVSSMFIGNGIDGDFVNDQIIGPYQALLEDLGDQFMLIDGSTPTYEWQLIQWHKKTSTAADLDQYYVSPNPTTLNKRMRA